MQYSRAKHGISQRHALCCIRDRKRRAATMLLGAVAMLALSSPVSTMAAPGQDQPQAWPVRLKQDMVRLGLIEWRLRTAAGNACPTLAADAGLIIDDRRAYDRKDWPLLAKTIGLQDDPQVIGLVGGGPAARAGLREGDAILAVGGQSVTSIVDRRKAGALVAEALVEEIAASDPGQPVAVSVRRDGAMLQFRIQPAMNCAARLVLVTNGSVDAHSDSRNVAISTGLIAFARNDDEIALAAGHEMAHIMLHHRKGGGIAARRRMEDDADSLGLRLMRCAGYDGEKALDLFRRLGSGDWLGFLRAPTHRSFGKRVARLKTELAGAACPVELPDGHAG